MAVSDQVASGFLGFGYDRDETRLELRKQARRAEPYEFMFPYDWRRDISEHAVALDALVNRAVDRVVEGKGVPRDSVKLDMMGHSMGGLVLRYYLRYGTQPLPEDGSLPPLTWAGAKHARRVIIAGSPNSGSTHGSRASRRCHHSHTARWSA